MRFRPQSKLLRTLAWRGLIADVTRPRALDRHLLKAPRTLYVGFDPTADSLHVGSLLPLLVLRRAQKAGHRPIVLVGGGTGLIGDPSGKAGERVLNPGDQVAEWAERLKRQVERFVEFDGGDSSALVVDNYDWLSRLEVIPFLRDTGKHFGLGAMLAKESVKSRMGRSDVGISYTEFSYQILQAYDFRQLFRRYRCTIQVGGSDQWGNITAGIDLIKRAVGKPAYGVTLPLVTQADGTKFGKTETGTVWLDGAKTSPYEMYQFWLNTADADVVKCLKYFTFFKRSAIRELESRTRNAPERREAQRALARSVTALVHGKRGMAEAEEIGAAFFSGNVHALKREQLVQACRSMPSTVLPREELELLTLPDVLVRTALAPSKRAARELIAAGAVQVNGRTVTSPEFAGTRELLHGGFIVIRKGKRTYHAISVP